MGFMKTKNNELFLSLADSLAKPELVLLKNFPQTQTQREVSGLNFAWELIETRLC